MNTTATVSAKAHSIEQLLARASAINERYVRIWQNTAPTITDPLAGAIADIASAHIKLGMTSGLELGAAIGACDMGFARVSTIVRQFVPTEVRTELSLTFLMATAEEIASFESYYGIYTASGESEAIYADIVISMKKRALAAVEAEYMASGTSAAPLYRLYLQTALDATKSAVARSGVLAAIERAKTHALIQGAPASWIAPEPPSANIWPIQRFGLMPVVCHLTAIELANYCFSGPTKTSKSRTSTTKDGFAVFLAAAQARKTNVLALVYSTPTVVEYDISKLIDPKAANGYIQPAIAGVSSMTLDRFALTQQYTAEGRPNAPAFELQRHELGAEYPWIIVRSLDGGGHWDVMQCKGPDPASCADMRAIVEKMTRGPSPRIDVYGALKNAVFSRAFGSAPVADVISDIKADNRPLANTLVSRISGRVIQYVDKKLVPLPTKVADLDAAIADPEFANIMATELIKSYAECGVSAGAPADEYQATFLADAEIAVIVQFGRNLKLGMLEAISKTRVFKDYSGDALRTRLYNIFVDVIKAAVSGALLTKESIYDKVLIKDAFLKVSRAG